MANLPEQVHGSSTEVAVRANPNSGFDLLDGSMIRLPRMKFAQMISRVVARELVPYGAVYVVTSQDDEEPSILRPAAKLGELTKPLRFYVLGVRPGWSYTDLQGNLARTNPGRSGIAPYPDLTLVKDGDSKKVRRTYDYTLALPDYPELPVMFIMHGKWGGQSAQQINTRIKLLQSQGKDPSQFAFKLSSRKTEDAKGAFAAAVVGSMAVPAKDVEGDLALVASHLEILGANNVVIPDEDAEPSYNHAPVDAPSLD